MEWIKLICLKECKGLLTPNDIYKGHWMPLLEQWHIVIKVEHDINYSMNFDKEYFLTLADYRDLRINEILI